MTDKESETGLVEAVAQLVKGKHSRTSTYLTFPSEAQQPAKLRTTPISETIESVTRRASRIGLSSAMLDALVDLISLPNKLDQSSSSRVVRSLFPAAKVHDDCVYRALGCLGLGQHRPGLGVQVELLRWIVLVLDVLENPAVLGRMYGFLFNLLDIIAIRSVMP
jgi:centromere protein I